MIVYSRERLITLHGTYSAALTTIYPADPGRLYGLEVVSEYLADFDKAYEIAQRLKNVQPNNINRLQLAEAAFTAGKFSAVYRSRGVSRPEQVGKQICGRPGDIAFCLPLGSGGLCVCNDRRPLAGRVSNQRVSKAWLDDQG